MKHHVTVHSISSTWSWGEGTAIMSVIADTAWVGVDVAVKDKPVVLFRFCDTHSRVTLLQFEDYEWLSDYLHRNLAVIVWAKIVLFDSGEVYLKDMDMKEYLL